MVGSFFDATQELDVHLVEHHGFLAVGLSEIDVRIFLEVFTDVLHVVTRASREVSWNAEGEDDTSDGRMDAGVQHQIPQDETEAHVESLHTYLTVITNEQNRYDDSSCE